MIAAGDTAALRSMYQSELSTPGSRTYAELMNAGVCMARAEMERDATVLFRAAVEKNAYHRDALSNLAIMLVNSEQHDAALPIARRLVSVEPNNADNLQLLVMSYAGIAKKARDQRAAASKTPTKTGAKTTTKAGATTRLTAAQLDSLFKFESAYRRFLAPDPNITEFDIDEQADEPEHEHDNQDHPQYCGHGPTSPAHRANLVLIRPTSSRK